MLTPKNDPPRVTTPAIISVRLTAEQSGRLSWLMEHLNMTRSEVIQALISQEYAAQQEATA